MRRKILKSEANSFVAELTHQMTLARVFYNVRVTPHKDPNYVWVVIG